MESFIVVLLVVISTLHAIINFLKNVMGYEY